VLEAKEGLTLVNGTQAMCAVGSHALLEAEALTRLFDLAGAMTVRGPARLAQAVPRRRPRGAAARPVTAPSRTTCGGCWPAASWSRPTPTAARCRPLLPALHAPGARRRADGVAFARKILEVEINAGTDNPLVFAETGEIVSAGNFHGQPISLASTCWRCA